METLSAACGAVALIGSHHSSLIALLKSQATANKSRCKWSQFLNQSLFRIRNLAVIQLTLAWL